MLKKMILLVALVALVASTQVFAADEAAAPAKPTPPPARERTAPGGQGGGQRGMGMGMGMRGFDAATLFGGLDLTEEQKTKMQEIQKATAEKAQAAQTAQMQTMMKVNSLVMSGGTEADIRAAAADYAKSFTEASIMRAKTVGEMKALLTAEQKTKFEEQMKQRQEQMNQMGQGGGRGPRGGAGPDGAAPRTRPAAGGQN